MALRLGDILRGLGSAIDLCAWQAGCADPLPKPGASARNAIRKDFQAVGGDVAAVLEKLRTGIEQSDRPK